MVLLIVLACTNLCKLLCIIILTLDFDFGIRFEHLTARYVRSMLTFQNLFFVMIRCCVLTFLFRLFMLSNYSWLRPMRNIYLSCSLLFLNHCWFNFLFLDRSCLLLLLISLGDFFCFWKSALHWDSLNACLFSYFFYFTIFNRYAANSLRIVLALRWCNLFWLLLLLLLLRLLLLIYHSRSKCGLLFLVVDWLFVWICLTYISLTCSIISRSRYLIATNWEPSLGCKFSWMIAISRLQSSDIFLKILNFLPKIKSL